MSKKEANEVALSGLEFTSKNDYLEKAVLAGVGISEASKYWDANLKGTKGASLVAIFDALLIERDFTKDEVKDFIEENGGNKTSALGFYVSRANLAKQIKEALSK